MKGFLVVLLGLTLVCGAAPQATQAQGGVALAAQSSEPDGELNVQDILISVALLALVVVFALILANS